MKANELMIGDWVLVKSNGVVPDSNVKVIEIAKDGVFIEDCDNLIGYSEIEPIPLTEDILKANGFRQNARKEWFFPNVKQGFKFMFIDDIIEECVFGDDIQLQYVHELQHAMRLCGLNELADNFKIE